MTDALQGIDAYLDAIERDACYRVEEVLKESPAGSTELVYFVGANGAEQGPYVRKRFDVECGMGGAYARIMEAQRAGRRFLHLPRVFDCHSDGRELSVVMEYVAGETLADVVYRCDPSLVLAADLFPRLCDAVSELHESFDPPIIHRDLKPSNVIVTADSLTLIDFGIARTYREGAEDDTRHFGTRAYAPPEQFGFGQTSVRSDVYALGMLLYYCLAEKTPTPALREARFAVPEVPGSLRGVLAKATAFDPAARYASVRELKTAFERAVFGAVHPGAPAGRQESARQTAGRQSAGCVRAGRPGAGCEGAERPSAESANAARRPMDRPPVARTPVARPTAGSAQAGAGSPPGFFAESRPADGGAVVSPDRVSWTSPVDGSSHAASRRSMAAIARDLLSVSFLLIWAAACIACMVDPQLYGPLMEQQGTPRWVVIVQYAALILAGACLAWIAFDRKHLRGRFPRLPQWPFRRAVVKSLVALVAFTLLVGVLPLFF